MADLRLWWTPSHVNLLENDLADAAAQTAALDPWPPLDLEAVPTCRTALRGLLRQTFVQRLDRQWALCDRGRDLFDIMPTFSTDLSWTDDLSRCEVALVAQFLMGHYATNAYLCRFGSRSDPRCDWCEAAMDDRQHRLFSCPRFTLIRQRLSAVLEADSREGFTWTWTFLTGPGRRYLAHFLRSVQVVVH